MFENFFSPIIPLNPGEVLALVQWDINLPSTGHSSGTLANSISNKEMILSCHNIDKINLKLLPIHVPKKEGPSLALQQKCSDSINISIILSPKIHDQCSMEIH